ncbi:MAG: hypothetical protein HQK89_05370 [Nitrospirae bacterium]|nr:hypothetical protein [Nitrospirota bacterium]
MTDEKTLPPDESLKKPDGSPVSAEKILPQDKAAKERDAGEVQAEKTSLKEEPAKVHDDGPVPSARYERIKLATEKGGLKLCPTSFSDKNKDWEIINSDNPFEILYLDYRAYASISRTMIDGNFVVIKKFWADVNSDAMRSARTANKYGGMDSIHKYPMILTKSYERLTADEKELRRCFDEIIKNKQESIRSSIEHSLTQGEYTPVIRKSVTNIGRKIGLTEAEVASFLIGVLKEEGFTPELEDYNGPLKETDSIDKKLSVIWRTDEKHLAVSLHKFQTFLDGKLNNGIYNPKDYVSITEAATGFLKNDAKKLKTTLIDYLKEKSFKPVGKFKTGNDLTVEWKTNWAKRTTHPLILKVVIFLGVVVIIAGLFYATIEKEETQKRKVEVRQAIEAMLKAEQEKLKAQQEKLKAEQEKNETLNKAAADKKRLEDETRQANESKFMAEEAKLKAEQEKLKAQQEKYEVLKQADADKKWLEDGARQKKKTEAPTVATNAAERKKRETDALIEARQYLKDGIDYFNKGRLLVCIEQMKEVLKRDPNNAEARSYIDKSQAKIDEANSEFEKLIIK